MFAQLYQSHYHSYIYIQLLPYIESAFIQEKKKNMLPIHIWYTKENISYALFPSKGVDNYVWYHLITKGINVNVIFERNFHEQKYSSFPLQICIANNKHLLWIFATEDANNWVTWYTLCILNMLISWNECACVYWLDIAMHFEPCEY